jgi:hypothetical protein
MRPIMSPVGLVFQMQKKLGGKNLNRKEKHGRFAFSSVQRLAFKVGWFGIEGFENISAYLFLSNNNSSIQ